MTTRDVQAHIADVYQVEVSPELVSKITDAVLPELKEWQTRPLEPVYPILYLDAIVVKVRTDGQVRNRPVYVALAVDLDGRKHVLGLRLGSGNEGAKHWYWSHNPSVISDTAVREITSSPVTSRKASSTSRVAIPLRTSP